MRALKVKDNTRDAREPRFSALPAEGTKRTSEPRPGASRNALEETIDLYGIRNWGGEYFDVNRAGEVVLEARRLGIAQVLSTSSSEDLSALADAARFERQSALARDALIRAIPARGLAPSSTARCRRVRATTSRTCSRNTSLT